MGTVQVSEQELEQLETTVKQLKLKLKHLRDENTELRNQKETLAETCLLSSNDWTRHDMGTEVEGAEADDIDEEFIAALKIMRDDKGIRVYEKKSNE